MTVRAPSLPAARGGVAGRAAFFRHPDVTKQNPEEASLTSTLDLSGAMEDLAAPAYVIDREGRYRWLNDAFIELLGDRRGQPFVDVIVPEHRVLARTKFARKAVGKTTRIYDLQVVDRLGNTVTLRTTLGAASRHNGKVVGVFGIAIPLDRAIAGKNWLCSTVSPRQQRSACTCEARGRRRPSIAKRLGIADKMARNHIERPATDGRALALFGGRRDGDAPGRARFTFDPAGSRGSGPLPKKEGRAAVSARRSPTEATSRGVVLGAAAHSNFTVRRDRAPCAEVPVQLLT